MLICKYACSERHKLLHSLTIATAALSRSAGLSISHHRSFVICSLPRRRFQMPAATKENTIHLFAQLPASAAPVFHSDVHAAKHEHRQPLSLPAFFEWWKCKLCSLLGCCSSLNCSAACTTRRQQHVMVNSFPFSCSFFIFFWPSFPFTFFISRPQPLSLNGQSLVFALYNALFKSDLISI